MAGCGSLNFSYIEIKIRAKTPAPLLSNRFWSCGQPFSAQEVGGKPKSDRQKRQNFNCAQVANNKATTESIKHTHFSCSLPTPSKTGAKHTTLHRPLDAEQTQNLLVSLLQTYCRFGRSSRSATFTYIRAHTKSLIGQPASASLAVFAVHSSNKMTFDGRESAREPTTVAAGTVPGEGH